MRVKRGREREAEGHPVQKRTTPRPSADCRPPQLLGQTQPKLPTQAELKKGRAERGSPALRRQRNPRKGAEQHPVPMIVLDTRPPVINLAPPRQQTLAPPTAGVSSI